MDGRTIEDADGRIWSCTDPHAVTNCNGRDCNPPRRLVTSGYASGGRIMPPMAMTTRPQDWEPMARAILFGLGSDCQKQ